MTARRTQLALLYLVFSVGTAPADAPAAAARPSPSAALARADARLGGRRVPYAREADGARTPPESSEAPYLREVRDDGRVERLPLKSTSANVTIAGSIARVQVHQTFENDRATPIEAVYVFPASTRAAVHGMRMKVGARTIEARIERRAAARTDYEAARREGRRASLLEQERPNVFVMRVANLMPRDRIEAELDYSELVVRRAGLYEFVYPAVVGPRYSRDSGASEESRWVTNPYLEGGAIGTSFDVDVHLETAISLKEVTSPSHKVSVGFTSSNSADVRLLEANAGNRDFILRYQLAGDSVDAGLLLWQGETEGFFALVMEPPKQPALDQIPRREYLFLLDTSGSMTGFPLDTAKATARRLLCALRPSDLFNLVTFSGSSDVMSPNGSVPATRDNVETALRVLEARPAGGGTELMDGLRRTYAIPTARDDIARTVIVVTDGFVDVEARAFRFVRERLGEATVFAVGIGSAVNRELIESLARAGRGEHFVILRPSEVDEQVGRLQQAISSPVLTDIRVRFPGFDAREVTPMNIPDLRAEKPLVILGKYGGAPRGAIEVSGWTGGGRFSRTISVDASSLSARNSPVHWLWAREWIAALSDEYRLLPAPELEEAITDLGLTYRLLSQFTSFVGIDAVSVNRGGEAWSVRQPLPLPIGVSSSAVARRTGNKTDDDFDQIFGASGGPPHGGSSGAYVPPAPGASVGVKPGPLGQGDIMEVVLASRGAIKRCTDEHRARNPEVSGVITMSWIIRNDGAVSNVETDTAELQRTSLSQCVTAVIKGFRFPAYSGAQMHSIKFPFKF